MTAIFTPLKGICGCQKGRFREGAGSHSERRVKTFNDTHTHRFYTVKIYTYKVSPLSET